MENWSHGQQVQENWGHEQQVQEDWSHEPQVQENWTHEVQENWSHVMQVQEDWSHELQVQASMLAWEINKQTEDGDVQAMLAKKLDYFEFVYTLITKQCEADNPKDEVCKVLKVVAQKWSDERKLRLVEYLVRDNHESKCILICLECGLRAISVFYSGQLVVLMGDLTRSINVAGRQ